MRPEDVKRLEQNIERMRNRLVDIEPSVQDGAPTNETGVSGWKMRAYASGATRELQVQINGTWYKATLTAV